MRDNNDIRFLRSGIAQMLGRADFVKTLRPKQTDVLAALVSVQLSDENAGRSYYKLPTGFGKTVIMAHMARAYIDTAGRDARRIVVVVPRLNLVDQARKQFKQNANLEISEYSSRVKNINSPVIVTTYLSLEKLLDRIGTDTVGLAFMDEAHHMLGAKVSKTLARLIKHTPVIGFTATPSYEVNKSVANLLDTEVYSMPIADGVANGLLCPAKNILFRSSVVLDLAQVPCKKSGEYDYDDIEGRIDTARVAREIAEIYATGYDNDTAIAFNQTRALVNCPTIDIARVQAAAINARMGRDVAVALHSKMDSVEYAKQQANFINGKYSVACQVGTMVEGFDDPSVSLCINYPTRSLVRAEQTAGRALRVHEPAPDKVAFIVDTVFRKSRDETLESILETAHSAHQALFRDVAGGTVLFPENFRDPDMPTRGQTKNRTPVKYADFQLITDSKVLMDLSSRENARLEREFVAYREPGWLTAKELAHSYIVGDPNVIRAALHRVRPQMPHAIQERRNANTKFLCLDMRYIDDFCSFAGMHRAEEMEVKTEEWLTAHELMKTHVYGSFTKIRDALMRHQADAPHAIQYRRSGTLPTICANKNYLDDVLRVTGLTPARDAVAKDDKWLGVGELRATYILGEYRAIADALRKYADAMPHAIQMRRHGVHDILCLDKDYLAQFCQMAGLRMARPVSGLKNEEWLNATELAGTYVFGNADKILDVLQQYADKLPDIIQTRRSGRRPVLCLNRDAIDQFCRATGMRRPIEAKTAQWLSATELQKKYIVVRTTAPITRELERLVHDMPYAIQLRQSGGYQLWCLNEKYVAEFVRRSGLRSRQNIEYMDGANRMNAASEIETINAEILKTNNAQDSK